MKQFLLSRQRRDVGGQSGGRAVRGPKYVVKRGKTPVLSAAAGCSIQLKVTL
jgi:hypothetical protein